MAWHWHEEFEYILAMKGPLTVDVNKTRVTLQTNQGVFLNSGILHAVEQAEKGEALLHSGVFHPRLVGGMDTIFWQKLIRPMLQPDAPAFFCWMEPCLAGAGADLPAGSLAGGCRGAFDYENRVRYYLSAALRLLSTQCVGGKTKVSQQEQIAAERMKQMLRFVEEHYAEELTVERIAASVALSESACLRSFRQMLGITPIQYVKQFRWKSRRAAPFHGSDGRDRDGVRLCRWQLLHQDFSGDQALHTQGIPRKILLKCLR